jgi:hypothetical protein
MQAIILGHLCGGSQAGRALTDDFSRNPHIS